MNVNNIRSPSYFFIYWLFIFGIVFSVFFVSDVKADVVMSGEKNLNSFSFPEKYNAKEDVQKLNSLLSSCEGNYNILVISTDYYNNNYYSNLKNYSILISSAPINFDGSKYFFDFNSDSFCCNLSISDSDKFSNLNSLSSTDFFLKNGLNSSFSYSVFPNVVYYNFVNGLNVTNGADTSFFPEPLFEYDVNDLNSYPFDTINIISPEENNIKTNSKYYTFSFKGKIKLEENDIEENVTPQIISKFIRNKFRYDFKSSKEDLTGLSSLGAFKINKDDSFKDEVMLQNLLDGKLSFNNEKYEVTDSVDDFVCGVSGDYRSWNSKGYYNFIVNTSIYVGDSPGTNEYKFYFTVPYKFKGIFSYKTITVNYSLERGIYSDDNFDCIDDETLEVIPPEEVEIIHPDYVFPSTSTPSGSNTFNYGDVVQNNNNNVLVNNCSDVSQEEHNGILNMLDNGLRITTGRLKSLASSLVGFRDSMNGLFSFLPEDVSNLFFVGISLTVVFFILGLRRR